MEYIYISQLIRYSKQLYVARQHSSSTCIWSIYLSVDSIFQTFICSNIPAALAYIIYISQLIRYSRACDSYQDFLDRGLLLTRKLLNQGFLLVKLKSSLRIFYGRHHDLVDRYGCSTCKHFPILSSFMTYQRGCS